MDSKREVKGKLFFAYAGDVVYSKIDVRNGAIGIVSNNEKRLAFSSEFPIYSVDQSVALPEYIKFVFRSSIFQGCIASLASGTSGRKRVQPDSLEELKIPIPSIDIQRNLLSQWKEAHEEFLRAKEALGMEITNVEEMILGNRPVPNL